MSSVIYLGVDPAWVKPTELVGIDDLANVTLCQSIPPDVARDPMRLARVLPSGVPHVVVERPRIERRVRPQTIVNLMQVAAAIAGAVAFSGAQVTLASSAEWRAPIYRGGAMMRKSVVLARLRCDYDLPADWSDDRVDAYGIALFSLVLASEPESCYSRTHDSAQHRGPKTGRTLRNLHRHR